MAEATTPEPPQDVQQNDLSFDPGDQGAELELKPLVLESPEVAINDNDAVEASSQDKEIAELLAETIVEDAILEPEAPQVEFAATGIEFGAASSQQPLPAAVVTPETVESTAAKVSESVEPKVPESAESAEPRTAENVDAIDILVQMATKGDIDPKAIDIIDVTDRFLKAIAAAPKENLRQSGKILFHASVLLRMKAEALLTYIDENPLGDDFLEFDENGSPIIYDSRNQAVGRQITLQDLERALVRRSHMKQARQRRVTLEQLIDALRDAERVEAVRVKKRIEPLIDLEDYHEVNDVEDILELAHDEDIEAVIERVETILLDSLTTGELMPLIKLIQILRGRSGKGDWVDAFLAVLFLSNAGKLTLEQEEFYGPLYLVRTEEAISA
jgi:segregation and condensation protein A